MKREIDKILKPGETVELVVYPQWRWLSQANIISVLGAVIWLGIIGKLSSVMFSLEKNGEWWTLFLLLLPFWTAGIGMAISPFWRRKRVNNTLYVVTNRRAIVAQPSPFLLQPETRTWYLEQGLIKSVYAQSDGCGDIVFDFRKVRTKHGWRDVPEGFLCVPELDRVADILRAQIEAAAWQEAEESVPVLTPEVWKAPHLLPPVPPRKRMSWKWCFALITPGLIACAIGGMALPNFSDLHEHGVLVQGVVVNKETGESPKLTVSYRDKDNFPYTHQTLMGRQVNKNYPIGGKVSVLYLPEKPSVVELADAKPNDLYIMIWGGVFMVIGGVLMGGMLYNKKS